MGSSSLIRKKDEHYLVELQGIHYVEGAPVDFVELFQDSSDALVKYIIWVRNTLTQFSFERLYVPRHNTYGSIFDPLGNMIIGFGREGYDLRHFPQTASDFIGPLKFD
jgi:hypothetical protein